MQFRHASNAKFLAICGFKGRIPGSDFHIRGSRFVRTCFSSRIIPYRVPVFQIRDILVQMRMRILGSVPLTTDPEQKYFFLKFFYAYSFLNVYLHHSLKTKSHKEVTKQEKSRFCFIFLLVDGRTWIRETKYTDPEAEHCHVQLCLMLLILDC